MFYENALTPASSSARHDSSGYIDRNGFKSTAGSVHSYATSDIASDMDVASEADFNSSGVAGKVRFEKKIFEFKIENLGKHAETRKNQNSRTYFSSVERSRIG